MVRCCCLHAGGCRLVLLDVGVVAVIVAGFLYTKCPKHLNLKAEDYVCRKVDVIGVDNEK